MPNGTLDAYSKADSQIGPFIQPIRLMRKITLVLITLLTLFATANVSAITIDSDRLLGTYTKNGGGNSPSDELGFLVNLLKSYNDNAVPLPTSEYLLTVPSPGVPSPILTLPTTYATGGSGSSTMVNASIGLYEWMSIKASKTIGFYYIGDVNVGTHTLKNDFLTTPNGKNLAGISHWNFFGPRTSTPVPDSGTTFALLGAALLGLVAFRSRKS